MTEFLWFLLAVSAMLSSATLFIVWFNWYTEGED